MKAKITGAKFKKEFTTQFGTLYAHRISYNGKEAVYNSKSQDQKKFEVGKEAEFTEEYITGQYGEYTVIKPVMSGGWKGNSNYVKDVKREQSKYSGFATSYVKDLIIADKINIKDWEKASKKIFNFMVELDKAEELK